MTTAEHLQLAQRWLFLYVLETASPAREVSALKAQVLPAREQGGEQLRGAIIGWMERYRLKADWLFRVVLDASRHWERHPDPYLRLANAYAPAFSEPLTFEERSVHLHLRWSPQTETRAQFLERAAQRINERCNEIQALAASRGLRPTKVLRGRRGLLIWPYRAFLAYQCRGYTQKTIARKQGVSQQRVAAALADVARQTGIPLRSARNTT
jgi:hypothetical protein